MAFNVIFYAFSKKDNSTAVPSSGGTTYSCTLKDGCSIINPTIKLDLGPASSAPVTYTYCYIAAFNRYYWIKDWNSERGMWYASCAVDVLASYKTEIGNASEMVLRSSDEYDGRITDTLYPTMNEQVFYSADGSLTPWWPYIYTIGNTSFTDLGEFIVGLLSYTGSGDLVGGVNYVGMLVSDFTDFMKQVFNIHDPNQPFSMAGARAALRSVFTTMTDEEALNLCYLAENPYTDYIDSITWMPKSMHTGTHTLQDLYLGPNTLRVAYRTVDPKETNDFSWICSSIPKHPQSAARGSYLNLGPYSNYQLILPRVGGVNIDPVLLGDYSTLTVYLHIDQITGQGLYQVYVGDGSNVEHLALQQYAPIGVTVKIGKNKPVGTSLQMAMDVGQMATNVVNDIATGNGFNIGRLTGIAGIIRESKSPGAGRIGDSGGYCGLYPGYPILQSHHLYVTDADNDHNGSPLMRVRTLNTVPGYIVCQHGDISVSCTDTEISLIRQYLEGGFFYE